MCAALSVDEIFGYKPSENVTGIIWKRKREKIVFERGYNAADHSVNFQPHDGYAPRHTREVMKESLVWTSDGIRCCMTIICVCMEQYLFVWAILVGQSGCSLWSTVCVIVVLLSVMFI